MSLEPRYHPELHRRFVEAVDARDYDAIDAVALEVLRMPRWEVVLFTAQVALCVDDGDDGRVQAPWRVGLLTGALTKLEVSDAG